MSAVANPNRSFRELESIGEFVDLRIRRNDRIDRGIEANDFDVDLARRDRDGSGSCSIEREFRVPHEDVIGRGIEDWSIDAEHGDLDLLPRVDIASHDQPIAGIPAADHGSATLAKSASNLSVNPDLGIVV